MGMTSSPQGFPHETTTTQPLTLERVSDSTLSATEADITGSSRSSSSLAVFKGKSPTKDLNTNTRILARRYV